MFPFYTFYQTGCNDFSWDIHYPISYFGGLLFFPHKRPKKRSKRTPFGYLTQNFILLNLLFVQILKFCQLIVYKLKITNLN